MEKSPANETPGGFHHLSRDVLGLPVQQSTVQWDNSHHGCFPDSAMDMFLHGGVFHPDPPAQKLPTWPTNCSDFWKSASAESGESYQGFAKGKSFFNQHYLKCGLVGLSWSKQSNDFKSCKS